MTTAVSIKTAKKQKNIEIPSNSRIFLLTNVVDSQFRPWSQTSLLKNVMMYHPAVWMHHKKNEHVPGTKTNLVLVSANIISSQQQQAAVPLETV